MKAELSYKAHEKHLENVSKNENWRFYYINNKNSLLYQRSIIPFNYLQPFLKKQNKWLTIGDVNGLEANYLLEHNQDVLASDIATDMLQIAHKLGAIKEYTAVNVENIPFEDNTFDYIYCKESYHHFPRAYIGLYEMIRCAKKAVIVVESFDPIMHYAPLLMLKTILDLFNPNLINKFWKNRFSYEEVGNFVFKLSERELEKIAAGIYLPMIAIKPFDFPFKTLPEGVSQEQILTNNPDPKIKKKLYRKTALKRFLRKIKLLPPQFGIFIIFKKKPENNLIKELKQLKYKIIPIPENPYLK